MLKNVSMATLIIISSFLSQQCVAKILIIVPVYNRPEFIEIQHKTFKKFLKDDYEIMMFNDANDTIMEQTIAATCSRLDITCIRVPQKIHNIDPNCVKAPASFRHGEVMQFAFENYAFHHDDIVMLIDSDVFLIREFSIRDHLGDNDLFGTFQDILVAQLCFFNMPKLENRHELNFRAKILSDGSFSEAGWMTREYVTSHNLKIRPLNVTWGIMDRFLDPAITNLRPALLEKGFSDTETELLETLINIGKHARASSPSSAAAKVCFDYDIGLYENGIFLDYKHGSGWHGPAKTNVLSKNQLIKEFIDIITQ